MYFDGHVHGRSWGESYKDTLERVLAVAQAAGISALVLMGNTKPGLTTAELCIEYVRLARRINPRIKSYGCITGTKDPEQNKRAVEAVRKNEEIVAIKDYLAPSTNPETSVTDPEDQLMQLEVRQKMGFKGVSMEHPECVNIMFDHLYDKDHPESWNRVCRPIESEIAAYTRRKQAAEQVGYEGILNFTHTTSSFVINDILTYEGPLKLDYDVTIHHANFNDDIMKGPDGRFWKCNPPLRSEEEQKKVKQTLLDGNGKLCTDHANHDLVSKNAEIPSSGVAILAAWPDAVQDLRNNGLSESQIQDITWDRWLELFGLDIDPWVRPIDYEMLEKLRGSYPFDYAAHFPTYRG